MNGVTRSGNGIGRRVEGKKESSAVSEAASLVIYRVLAPWHSPRSYGVLTPETATVAVGESPAGTIITFPVLAAAGN